MLWRSLSSIRLSAEDLRLLFHRAFSPRLVVISKAVLPKAVEG